MALIKDVVEGEGVALTMPDGTEVLVFVHEIRSKTRAKLRVHAPSEVRIESADDRFDSTEDDE